jgi:hypothetical protein
MLTALFTVTLAQGLPANPQALPPPVHHMVLSAPQPKRSPEYQRAERKAAMLAHILVDPVMRNRVRTTPAQRTLALALAKAMTAEAFLSDGPERKALIDAMARFRAGMSPAVLKATIGYAELPDWLQK